MQEQVRPHPRVPGGLVDGARCDPPVGVVAVVEAIIARPQNAHVREPREYALGKRTANSRRSEIMALTCGGTAATGPHERSKAFMYANSTQQNATCTLAV